MKTYLPNMNEHVRSWYLLDAKGRTAGSIATIAADLLRGKRKPTFTPHLDTGDGVIIINSTDVVLTGNKWQGKEYASHSGYQGGFKSITAIKLHEKKPEAVLEQAISGMIPKNKLKKEILKRLRIFSGAEHTLVAQKPEPYSF